MSVIPRWTVRFKGSVRRIVAASAVQAALGAAYNRNKPGEYEVKPMDGFFWRTVRVIEYGDGFGVETEYGRGYLVRVRAAELTG